MDLTTYETVTLCERSDPKDLTRKVGQLRDPLVQESFDAPVWIEPEPGSNPPVYRLLSRDGGRGMIWIMARIASSEPTI